jgi:hypothetical protein
MFSDYVTVVSEAAVKGKPRKVSRTQWENGQGATQKMPAEE